MPTLLHNCELWTELATTAASRVEAVHMRWLRKATGAFRSAADLRCTVKGDLRVTDQVASTWSLIACRRLRYLSSFKKASPYLKALLQNEGKLHPWVRLVIHDLEELQGCSPKLHMLLPPSLDVDAWVAFAIAYPKSWRKFIQAWLTSASPVQTDVLMGTCAFCWKTSRARFGCS